MHLPPPPLNSLMLQTKMLCKSRNAYQADQHIYIYIYPDGIVQGVLSILTAAIDLVKVTRIFFPSQLILTTIIFPASK
jgi:hypothetical protein